MCEIQICLGSSCFSRGNSANLRLIEEYVAARGLAARVVTTGHLCEDQCSHGPNLIFNGVMHHTIDAAKLRDLLEHYLGTGERP
jgi:NADH:ubiquinone oxidoreductase subunit E